MNVKELAGLGAKLSLLVQGFKATYICFTPRREMMRKFGHIASGNCTFATQQKH
jgi:hypothetical protein